MRAKSNYQIEQLMPSRIEDESMRHIKTLPEDHENNLGFGIHPVLEKGSNFSEPDKELKNYMNTASISNEDIERIIKEKSQSKRNNDVVLANAVRKNKESSAPGMFEKLGNAASIELMIANPDNVKMIKNAQKFAGLKGKSALLYEELFKNEKSPEYRDYMEFKNSFVPTMTNITGQTVKEITMV
jgi:hypothetical protein